MKSMKKFLALALALALCFAMAIPAMATEGENVAAGKTQTLTLENPTPGHTYSVYQIFTGDVGEKDGKDALANIKYGVNFGGFGADEAVGTAVDSSVTDAILGAGEGFASDLLAALRDKDAPYKTMGPAEEGKTLTVEVETGYYLIVDNGSDADDTVSALMVQIIGDTSVKTKTTDTTMDKTVETVNPDEFTDDAGHTIGEVFQFKLEAKIPVAQLSSFDKYMIRFKDTMSDGLTFVKINSVQVENGKVIPAEGYKFQYTDDKYNALEEEPESQAGVSFTVEIENLFEFIGEKDWPTVTDEETGLEYVKVVLTYDAYLNENAIVMGTGTEENGTQLGDTNANKNTGSLDFTRNPDNEEEGSTTPDESYVFTLKIDGTKYKDEIGEDNRLEGAGFTLYTAEQDKNGKWVKGNPILFKEVAGKGMVYDKVDEAGKGTEITTGTEGKFVFNGLGPGNYILSETTVPEGGYNRSADILITVTEGEKNPTTHTITCTVTKKYIGNEDVTDEDADKLNNNGTGVPGEGAAIQVVNKTGTLLPSTGGIGTTIFYAVGAALVVGAGILLFVKKRMGSKG
ncbi:MAG: isopeptide-forming domain-containing fimbrial protein [Acutalibacter sp.]|jgi:fimbrial isopeptide formation D2 family protein/LPXTG-motif cell wall-anchored protein|nr:isopeptide-forming domain-containing fimbrial protein [Acutalibacter sp.]